MVRHKSRMGGGHRFDFFMSLSPTNDMYCFTGKKQSVAKGCYYSISLDQEESKRSKGSSTDSFIGKVRSDRKSWLGLGLGVRVKREGVCHIPSTHSTMG